MDKAIIKQAFDAAEKERQEKDIARIKEIVQKHLENIAEKQERKNKLELEIKSLRKDLDDMKAGRLDLLSERHEKDPQAREIGIIIVKKVEREYIPMYPWKSPWVIELKQTYTPAIGSATLCTTGNSISNFTLGTYTVNTSGTNQIINL